MKMERGFRTKLESYISLAQPLTVRITTEGSAIYDTCCFGVDASGKLSDDRYMVFYNQPVTPQKEIQYTAQGNTANYQMQLQMLPESIAKLVFTVSIDGAGTMGEIQAHRIELLQNGQVVLELSLSGSDFQEEKAIIGLEIYRKDVWRVAVVARGFNGGLEALLKSFGGEVAGEQPANPPIPPIPQSIIEQAAIPPVPQPAVQPAPVIEPVPQPIAQPAPPPAEQKKEKISLKKGEKISLTKKQDQSPIRIECGWTAPRKDYDLKALVRYRNGGLVYIGAANADERLSTPEGAVRHGGDVKNPGELEHIEIQWHPDIASVAVSSYSALENGYGSFRQYGVYVRIINGRQIIEIPAADTSANGNSYTLCFGEILFGAANTMEVSALEMYSRPNSENRIGYVGDQVKMDIGPKGKLKK